MTKDKLLRIIDDVIENCISNNYSFGYYAHRVTETVWPLLEAAEKERDVAELISLALRAKIEAMERQEPVGFLDGDGCAILQRKLEPWADLYALPGAQGEEK